LLNIQTNIFFVAVGPTPSAMWFPLKTENKPCFQLICFMFVLCYSFHSSLGNKFTSNKRRFFRIFTSASIFL